MEIKLSLDTVNAILQVFSQLPNSSGTFGLMKEIERVAQAQIDEAKKAQEQLDQAKEAQDGTLSLDYPKLTATLVAAIQELNAKLDAHIQGA